VKVAANESTDVALINAWMSINPTYCKNHERDKDTRAKKNHREIRIKTLTLISLLSFTSNFAIAECSEYMQAFNKHQFVIKGMMDLNFQGKMNAEVGDAIGKYLQEAQQPLDTGDYNKTCEMYDSIIDDYGFDKSFGEAPEPEKKAESTGDSSSKSSDESGAALSSSSAEGSNVFR
jgi:hypothetical protein